MVSVGMVRSLREKTGAPIHACSEALKEAEGNEERAFEILRSKGETKATRLKDLPTGHRTIGVYTHFNRGRAAVVVLGCETEGLSRSAEFNQLADLLAMHVAACNPLAISEEHLSADIIAKETTIAKEQLANQGKPQNIVDKIVEGRVKKFVQENCLLSQPFITTPKLTVQETISALVSSSGENIRVISIYQVEV